MPASSGVSLDLLAAWAAGRSISRGLPMPIVDGDAVRVDTGLPAETRRHIFPAATPALIALAATITAPRILLKLCAPAPALMALLPPGWRAHPQSFFMVGERPMPPATRPLPDDLTLTVAADGVAATATITTRDGALAARGRAVAHGGLFVYDQNRTEPAHQRRGLGGHIMRALAAMSDGGRPTLTATAAGHALYTTLGWTTLSLYSTAEFGGTPEP